MPIKLDELNILENEFKSKPESIIPFDPISLPHSLSHQSLKSMASFSAKNQRNRKGEFISLFD